MRGSKASNGNLVLNLKSYYQSGVSRLTSAYEVGGGKSRIIAMEGLRGFAVLLVFFVHFHALFGTYLPNGIWLRTSEFLGTIGNSGVDLFFVMSGYLIYGALIRRGVGYFKFTSRRVKRIYPAFLAVFILYLALSALFPQQSKIHGGAFLAGRYIVANLLLLPGIFNIQPIISVAWSLSYEFFFYLTLPIVVWLGRMRQWKTSRRLVTFALLWLMFGLASLHYGPDTRARMISFIAGIVLYEVISIGRARFALTTAGEFLTALLVPASFGFFYHVHRPRSESQINGFLPVFALSVVFFFVSLYCFEFGGSLTRVFSWSPLRYLGNMSYSYYLIHGVTLEAVALVWRKAGLSFSSLWVVFSALILGFCATWVTASLLFFLVEKRYSLLSKSATAVNAAEMKSEMQSTPSSIDKKASTLDLPVHSLRDM
jgi:peptidoglycan/LPS O-acetylase OafA/YrhL